MEKEIEEPQTAAPADHEKVVSASAPPKGASGMYSSAAFASAHVGAASSERTYKVPPHIEDQYKD
jgi:hypothetical protein